LTNTERNCAGEQPKLREKPRWKSVKQNKPDHKRTLQTTTRLSFATSIVASLPHTEDAYTARGNVDETSDSSKTDVPSHGSEFDLILAQTACSQTADATIPSLGDNNLKRSTTPTSSNSRKIQSFRVHLGSWEPNKFAILESNSANENAAIGTASPKGFDSDDEKESDVGLVTGEERASSRDLATESQERGYVWSCCMSSKKASKGCNRIRFTSSNRWCVGVEDEMASDQTSNWC